MTFLDQAINQVDEVIKQLSQLKSVLPQDVDESKVQANGAATATQPQKQTENPDLPKPKKEKKPKESKPQEKPQVVTDEDTELFNKICIKVGRITSVEGIENSDKLYKLKIAVSENETRQICGGLKMYLSEEFLANRLVCVVYNLRTAKLAGQSSEGMVMACEYTDGDKTIVSPLEPPENSEIGDQLFLEGGSPSTNYPKTIKTDHFRSIFSKLKVQDAKADFNGKSLTTQKGFITLPSITPNGAAIK